VQIWLIHPFQRRDKSAADIKLKPNFYLLRIKLYEAGESATATSIFSVKVKKRFKQKAIFKKGQYC